MYCVARIVLPMQWDSKKRRPKATKLEVTNYESGQRKRVGNSVVTELLKRFLANKLSLCRAKQRVRT